MRNRFKITDFILINNYVNGDEKALETLIKRHKSSLLYFISFYVRDNDVANDIFQDAFILFIEAVKTGKYKNNGRFSNYFKAIAHNLVMNYWRESKKIPRNSGDDDWNVFDNLNVSYSEGNLHNVEKKIQENESIKTLIKAFDKLPEKHQEIIHLRLKENKSFKEIASERQLSINTCLGQYRHAITCLRKIIIKHDLMLELQ